MAFQPRKRRRNETTTSSEGPDLRPPLGSTSDPAKRVEKLARRMEGSGNIFSGTRDGGEEEEKRSYNVQYDPRYRDIQMPIIHRWQQEFLTKQHEENKMNDEDEEDDDNDGDGDNDDNDDDECMDEKETRLPTKYKSASMTLKHRKTLTERLIDSGQIESAIEKMRGSLFKTNKRAYIDPNTLEITADFISSQTGLQRISQKQSKKAREHKRVDITTLC